MLLDLKRIEESLERARPLSLGRTIDRLGKSEGRREASPRAIDQRRATLLRQVGDALVANVRLERILQGNELNDINYLAQGLACARSVCRVSIRSRGRLLGYGTGFLVAPGVLMTNHHVLSSLEEVQESRVEFRYERDLKGADLEPAVFALRTSPEPVFFKDLDFALVAVAPVSEGGEPLSGFGWLKLNVLPNKALIGEYLTIIQHPNGERKQVCVRENKLIRYSEDGPYLWYQTDTVGGSSGSPVFNNSWEVVALHHSGVPRTKRVGGKDVWLAKDGRAWDASMGEDAIDWIANEGVRISRIAQYLEAEHAATPIARQVREAGESPLPESLSRGTEGGIPDGVRVETGPRGRTRILVPIDIDVNIGGAGVSVPGAPATRPAAPAAVPFAPRAVEKVEIDQTNYARRNGYNPKFLGAGFVVPLPKVAKTAFGKPLAIQGKDPVLKYWNYSVVMNRERRLAFFSAANIDAGRFRGERDKDGDAWFDDPRVNAAGAGLQLGKDWYKGQKKFEADRTKNPFDQGHLSRRSDLQWGDTDAEAKRNGDDTYHYPNCAPQHWRFNQNNSASGLWYRLEDLAIQTAGQGRLCVINGPVFDAPLGKPGADGQLRLDLAGKRVKDRTFGGARIPKQFFKVMAYKAAGELRAKAFVVTQEDLLATVERLHAAEKGLSVLTDLEVRLYQVRIADLERLTGLDFGTLRQHDAPANQESLFVERGLPIADEGDLVF